MRRLLAALIGLALLCAPALARTCAVQTDERALLITEEGELLVSKDAYVQLWRVSDAACPDERALFAGWPALVDLEPGSQAEYARIGVLDARGVALSECVYDGVSHDWENGLVIVSAGGRYGALDEEGGELLPCAYGFVASDGEGGFWVTPEDTFTYNEYGLEDTARLYHIAADGVAVDTGIVTDAHIYAAAADGGPFLVPVRADASWQYIYVDARGAVLGPYTSAEGFRDGLAAARLSRSGVGLIRPDGSWALEPVYEDINYGTGALGAFYAVRGKTVDIFDRATLALLATYTREDAERVYAFESGAFLTLNADGDCLIVGADGQGLCRVPESVYISAEFVETDGEPNRLMLDTDGWGEEPGYLTDLSLNRVAGPYRRIEQGLWWKGGEGRFMVFDDASAVGAGGYEISVPGACRYGVIDQDGGVVLPLRYHEMRYLGEDRYWVRQGELYRLIDEAGTVYFEISQYAELVD